MSNRILVIADHLNGELNIATASAVSCAVELSAADIEVLVLADDGAALAGEAAAIEGVTRALHIDREENAHPTAAVLAPQIAAVAESGGYTHVLGPNTTFGKDLMPRVAAKLGVLMVTDIMAVHGPYEFDRPIYAGNAVTTVQAPDNQILVGSVRAASYAAAERGDAAPVEALTAHPEHPSHTRHVRPAQPTAGRPDLHTAPGAISGRRGVCSAENCRHFYVRADKTGAAVGASRAVVDAGYVPHDMQWGQPAKIISPD